MTRKKRHENLWALTSEGGKRNRTNSRVADQDAYKNPSSWGVGGHTVSRRIGNLLGGAVNPLPPRNEGTDRKKHSGKYKYTGSQVPSLRSRRVLTRTGSSGSVGGEAGAAGAEEGSSVAREREGVRWPPAIWMRRRRVTRERGVGSRPWVTESTGYARDGRPGEGSVGAGGRGRGRTRCPPPSKSHRVDGATNHSKETWRLRFGRQSVAGCCEQSSG